MLGEPKPKRAIFYFSCDPGSGGGGNDWTWYRVGVCCVGTERDRWWGWGVTWRRIGILNREDETLFILIPLVSIPIQAIVCVYSALPLGDLPEPEWAELVVLGREGGGAGITLSLRGFLDLDPL
jgi:hypothetical protein